MVKKKLQQLCWFSESSSKDDKRGNKQRRRVVAIVEPDLHKGEEGNVQSNRKGGKGLDCWANWKSFIEEVEQEGHKSPKEDYGAVVGSTYDGDDKDANHILNPHMLVKVSPIPCHASFCQHSS